MRLSRSFLLLLCLLVVILVLHWASRLALFPSGLKEENSSSSYSYSAADRKQTQQRLALLEAKLEAALEQRDLLKKHSEAELGALREKMKLADDRNDQKVQELENSVRLAMKEIKTLQQREISQQTAETSEQRTRMVDSLPPAGKTSKSEALPRSSSTSSVVPQPDEAGKQRRISSPRLGIEKCAGRRFVEWQDEDAGIIRLTRNQVSNEFWCSPKDIEFRCCRPQRSRWHQFLSKSLSFSEARELALKPYQTLNRTANPDFLARRDKDSPWSKEDSAGQGPFFQVAPHLVDPARHAALGTMRSTARCMCVVFTCAGEKAICQNGIDRETCQRHGKTNVLLRVPQSREAKRMSATSSYQWARRKRSGKTAPHQTGNEKGGERKDHHHQLPHVSQLPNVLLFFMDSVSWEGFRGHFPQTQQFFEEMKQRPLPEEVLRAVGRNALGDLAAMENERVALVEDTNGLGSASHWNHPPFLLGKLPATCSNAATGIQGTPTKEDGPYYERYLKLQKRVVTHQWQRERILQSHILKVAKDHGYSLTASLYPIHNQTTEALCLRVESEEDLYSVPEKMSVVAPTTTAAGTSAATGSNASSITSSSSPPTTTSVPPSPPDPAGAVTPIADIFQWHFYTEAVNEHDAIYNTLNGIGGCIGPDHSMDNTERFIDSLFLRGQQQQPVRRGEEEEEEDSSSTGPIFAFVAEQTPHQGSWDSGAIEYFDSRLAAMLRRLRDKGVLEDTVVVLTSDHGQGLGRADSRSALVNLLTEMTHPFLAYLVPPSTAIMGSSSSSSEVIRREYSRYLKKVGRREISGEVRELLGNIVFNAEKQKMKVTHFDTFATMVDLVSAHSAVSGEPKIYNADGVVEFARPMTINYTHDPQSRWLPGRPSFYDQLEEEGNKSQWSSEYAAQRVLRPTCTEMGVFQHSCRTFKDVDVLAIFSQHLNSSELGSVMTDVKVPLQAWLSQAVSLSSSGTAAQHLTLCTDWFSLRLRSFVISSIHQRQFEDESSFFTIFFDVLIPNGVFDPASEHIKLSSGGDNSTIARKVTFQATTKGKRSVGDTNSDATQTTASSVEKLRSTLSTHLYSLLDIASIKRFSTYAEDEKYCGKSAVDIAERSQPQSVKNHRWSGMEFCACVPKK